MRKAFIGLSSPVGFDYRNEASKTKADQHSSPNPILDSPFGLLILFDKIIFLSKSLCPENMRHLPYISFLNEENALPAVKKEEIDIVTNTILNYFQNTENTFQTGISFQESLKNAGILEGMGVDNHSHTLNIGEYSGQANADETHLAIDLLYYSKLNDPTIEIITNSRLNPTHNLFVKQWASAKLTELLVIENISNYLTPQGPYHPVIEEVRENKYIDEFRSWISKQKGLANLSEVKEMKQQVERTIKYAQDKLFLKYLDQKRHYKSIGQAILGDLIGLIYPAAGTTKALFECGYDLLSSKTNAWQGFVVSASASLSQKA